jgi:glycosyltransferase involved in cell wall biosynthesis
MKILFLTMTRIDSLTGRGIYIDLLNHIIDQGHEVCIVAPKERRYGGRTSIKIETDVKILNVKTLNLVKTSIIEKGLGQLVLERQFLRAIKKYYSKDKFDMVLYSTPPITFTKVIRHIKERDNAYAYLLLKDIFPQNAVDMGMISKDGFIHSYFRKKEKKLYDISDTIGCMSLANKQYVLDHNPSVKPSKVEVNPNTIKPVPITCSQHEKADIRQRYGLPKDRRVFVYGGNLGKPQGIDFLIEVLEKANKLKAHFLIIGDGTEYKKLKNWFDKNKPTNASLFKILPKEEYDRLLGCCDVGLIFLDNRFSIPNFPSRLLSYLEMRMPVISATDKNSDIGQVIENADCGISLRSGDIGAMLSAIQKMIVSDLELLGENAWKLLINDYIIERSYNLISEKKVGVN